MIPLNIMPELLVYAINEAAKSLGLVNYKAMPAWLVKDVNFRDEHVAVVSPVRSRIEYLTVNASNYRIEMAGNALIFSPNREELYTIISRVSDILRSTPLSISGAAPVARSGNVRALAPDWYNFKLYELHNTNARDWEYVVVDDVQGIVLPGAENKYMLDAAPGQYTAPTITEFNDVYRDKFKFAFGVSITASLTYYR